MLILSILVPVLWGLLILLLPVFRNRKALLIATGAGLAVTAGLGLGVIVQEDTALSLFSLGKNLELYFHVDHMGRLFAAVVILVWVLAGVYAFEYMKH